MARFVKMWLDGNGMGDDRTIEVNADAVLWIDEPWPGLRRCRLHMVGGETIDLGNQNAAGAGYFLNDRNTTNTSRP